MDQGKLSGWLQIAGNLGLIAGLVLVAYQINQTADITRDRIYFDRWAAWLDTGNVLLGERGADALAKAGEDPQSLTAGEIHVLQTYFGLRLDYWRRIKALGERGIISKDDWRAALDRNHPEFSSGLLGALRTPGGRAYWEIRRSHMQDGELVSAIDNALANEPIGDYRRVEQFRENILKYHELAVVQDSDDS